MDQIYLNGPWTAIIALSLAIIVLALDHIKTKRRTDDNLDEHKTAILALNDCVRALRQDINAEVMETRIAFQEHLHDLLVQHSSQIEKVVSKIVPPDMKGVEKALEEVNGTLTTWMELAHENDCFYQQHEPSPNPEDAYFDSACLRLGNGHWMARSYFGHTKVTVGGILIHKKPDGSICQSKQFFFDCRETNSLSVEKVSLEYRSPLSCGIITCSCGKQGHVKLDTWHDWPHGMAGRSPEPKE